MATTAERIQKLRTEFGLSQEELAKALGFSRDTISSWERGIRNPTGERLTKLARYFYVPEDYITCKSDVRLINDCFDRIVKDFEPVASAIENLLDMVTNLSNESMKQVYDFVKSLQLGEEEKKNSTKTSENNSKKT